MAQDDMDRSVLEKLSAKGGAQRRVTLTPAEAGLSAGDLRRTTQGLLKNGDVNGQWVGQVLEQDYADLQLTSEGVRRIE